MDLLKRTYPSVDEDDRCMNWLRSSYVERPEEVTLLAMNERNLSRNNLGSNDLLLVSAEESKGVPSLQCKPLSVNVTADGELTVNSVIPEGVKVATNEYGRCLVATKAFAAGSLVYRGYAALLNTSSKDDRFTLNLYHEQQVQGSLHGLNANLPPVQVFSLDGLNSVKDYEDPSLLIRQVYGFDGFMNHSCDANMYCPQVYRNKDELCYDSIALRDINPGDELTCDYACFDYECDGHEIVQCGCKAANCRGEMKGFKNLSLAEKIRIMPMTDPNVLEAFFHEHPKMILLESTIPHDNVRVEVTPDDVYITAAKAFAPGDLIFTNKSILISEDNLQGEKTFILKLLVEGEKDDMKSVMKKANFILLDKDRHFIHRPSHVECVGFDSFMDHSCNPNSEQHYENATCYSVFARSHIQVGSKITCDYQKLHNCAIDQESVVTTSFLCQCGTDDCRILIHA